MTGPECGLEDSTNHFSPLSVRLACVNCWLGRCWTALGTCQPLWVTEHLLTPTPLEGREGHFGHLH